MSTTMHDDIEAGVRELFERQAEQVSVDARAWDDPPMATVVAIPKPRRSRPAFAAVVATAATLLLVVGIAAIGPGTGVRVAGQPGSAVPVHFSTPQVMFDADALLIDAGGRLFTAAGSVVEVSGDLGTRNEYTTLELSWHESGVAMRLSIYFTSDGRNWWSDEIRTYDGSSPGDWIEYHGTYFRAPLGQAYIGNVDIAATVGTGRLRIPNLRLSAFRPPAACKSPMAKYALDVSYDRVSIPNGADGFGMGATTLLDTASCTAVGNPHAYTFDWQIADPTVVAFEFGPNLSLKNALVGIDPNESVQLTRRTPGTTTLQVTAHRKIDGKVVATAVVPVRVG